MKAYVDDVVVKTRNHDDFVADLEETFSNLCKFWWKLNLTSALDYQIS
jgi:hypothetical protein